MKQKVFIFDLKTDKSSDIVANVVKEIMSLPKSKWQVTIGKPKRTSLQNSTIHPIFEEVSEQWINIDFKISFGKFEATPTMYLVKEFFKGLYLGGKSTTEVTTKELADALTKFMDDVNKQLILAGAEYVIEVKSKELQNLLSQTNYE